MSASAESDSDDWEEVEVPEEQRNLEITISTGSKQTKKRGLTYSERVLRINCHKLHTLALLTNAWVRNKWINDPLLHARLLSLTPLSLQTAFAMIHKSRVPEQHKRGRMFETAMGHLTSWWAQTFFDVTFDGHLRNRTFATVQTSMDQLEEGTESWDVELLQEVLGDKGELIKGPKSLMKHALMQKGCRDTSAQLFTALCRGLGIPTRLVVSLQSVPWHSDKPKNNSNRKSGEEQEEVTRDVKGKGKAKADSSAFVGAGQRLDGGSVPKKSDKAKGKEKAKPAIKLRKSKPQGNLLGGGPSQIDPITTPPVFWTEVFSRPDGRWFPVDPVRGTVNQTHAFDPSYTFAYGNPNSGLSTPNAIPTSAYARLSGGSVAPPAHARNVTRAETDNRMVYVLAFEEDGYARDVTPRYARQYAARVAKMQRRETRGKREAWWDLVLEGVRRPYRLHRDDVEDAELDSTQLQEGMPTTVGGFKDHPMYVLVRHLTQTQTIHPPPPQTRELGKFRGEPVYPRSAVVSLKTAENWMRSEGRQIREGEQPMKWVKMRASTITRMREVEVMREGLRVAGEHAGAEGEAANGDGDNLGEGGSSAKHASKNLEGEVMQGLYALSQTELYVPDPVVDGKIPKNNFGNIDLYVPTMLPAGAVHLPFKGITKIARKLGFDFAEAVTGFEFKSKRANPVMKGIVIAAENEAAVLEAYREAENDAAEKARAKRRERVLKRWARLVHGLRIRQSLQEEYKDRQPASMGEKGEDVEVTPGLAGGGFVTGADDVVQAYQLPKYQHVNLPFQPSSGGNFAAGPSGAASDSEPAADEVTHDLPTMDVDPDPGVEDVQPLTEVTKKPKTMKELAEETTARLNKEFARYDVEEDGDEDVDIMPPPPPPPTTSAPKAKKARQAKPSRAQSERNPTKTKAKAGAGAPAARRASARKRRRNDGTDSDSEEEDSEPSPSKRAKASNGAPVPAPASVATGRSLRPRRTKTQTELEEEAEKERAFQRAVAK